MKPIHCGCLLGLAALAAGITTLADSAGTQVPPGHGTVTPAEMGFIQPNIWPTGGLLGGLEYRWTNGSKPYLSLAGIPAKLELDNRRVLLGVNYHF